MAPSLYRAVQSQEAKSTSDHLEAGGVDKKDQDRRRHVFRQYMGRPHHEHERRAHLVAQVKGWMVEERTRRHHALSRMHIHKVAGSGPDADTHQDLESLQELEKILSLHESNEEEAPQPRPILSRGKKSIGSRAGLLSKVRSRRKSTAGSSTDARDDEIHIPSCDVILDNTRVALAEAGKDLSRTATRSRAVDEAKHWKDFKTEVLKLTHTLRFKRWSRIALERASELQVKRLSGALTNAVYVISPPIVNLPRRTSANHGDTDALSKTSSPPDKLLLRIYGPQVEYLIDRDKELEILGRLSKNNIGPRMLGTFKNGRFEQFLESETLTAKDLRDPDISAQIGKRMKELHVGIDLLDEEREGGANVWANWYKWRGRAEEVARWADHQVEIHRDSAERKSSNVWRSRGYICCTSWHKFNDAVDRYHQWLDAKMGGKSREAENLVFAHSDTQYGNILRLAPPGDSPLLLPAMTHKRLVVIDFEYAGPNPIGVEFANHFSEWCYDYTTPSYPWRMQIARFPAIQEQRNLVAAYVSHKPSFGPLRRGSTSTTAPYKLRTDTGSVTSFLLEGRADPSAGKDVSAEPDEDYADIGQVDSLIEAARIWRPANSAHWVAWGIIQANLPEMEREESLERSAGKDEGFYSPQDAGEEDDGFDYLGYAQDRALFFWGDLLQLGIIQRNELPEELLSRVKTVHASAADLPPMTGLGE